MDISKLASGDNSKISHPNSTDVKENNSQEQELLTADTNVEPHEFMEENQEHVINETTISAKNIEENELKLKERIAQCKNIIASLKLELNEEKVKLEKEAIEVQLQSDHTQLEVASSNSHAPEKGTTDVYNVNMYSASVVSKLNCDETLMEYEKQLQRYQNTLNMAQLEKKNAIRKQMLAKAFKLKLMEVENQCNIELLRIKQSLQCLEPLKMIVEKWKVHNNDNVYDLDNFELIPRYPELRVNSGSDVTSTSGADDFGNKIPILNNIEKHD